jgi:hypothetical protein
VEGFHWKDALSGEGKPTFQAYLQTTHHTMLAIAG